MSSGRLRAVSTPPFGSEEIVHIGMQISQGLAYLHVEQRVLHGDVKSANVLVSRDLRTVKICDLGVSLQLTPDLMGVLHPDCEVTSPPPPECSHASHQ